MLMLPHPASGAGARGGRGLPRATQRFLDRSLDYGGPETNIVYLVSFIGGSRWSHGLVAPAGPGWLSLILGDPGSG